MIRAKVNKKTADLSGPYAKPTDEQELEEDRQAEQELKRLESQQGLSLPQSLGAAPTAVANAAASAPRLLDTDKLYIGGLTDNTTEEELRDFLTSKGHDVHEVRRLLYPDGNKKPSAIAVFRTPQHAEEALVLFNRANFKGTVLEVDPWKTRKAAPSAPPPHHLLKPQPPLPAGKPSAATVNLAAMLMSKLSGQLAGHIAGNLGLAPPLPSRTSSPSDVVKTQSPIRLVGGQNGSASSASLKPSPPSINDYAAKVHVCNIPATMTQRMLELFMGVVGRIIHTEIRHGTAVVAYDTVENAQAAIQEIDGTPFDDKVIRVLPWDSQRRS